MDLTPFLTAGLVIQLHALAALIALVLGPVALHGRRNRWHKIIGYVWMAAMVAAAGSSFWIVEFAVLGPLSPIHALSALALWSVGLALRHAWRRDFAAHARVLRTLYWRGVAIAALFNFLPGRVVNRVFFDDARAAGFVVIGLGAALILADLLRQQMRRQNRRERRFFA